MNHHGEDAEIQKVDYAESVASSSNGRCRSCTKSVHWRRFRSNLFLTLLLIGIIAGIGMGIGIRKNHPDFANNKRYVTYVEFPGRLLLRMLKMCIIPLVFFSLVSGMASIPSTTAGKLGGYAILYYMITTFMAVLLGILLVATIQPGFKAQQQSEEVMGSIVQPVDALLDLIRNLLPDNIIGACLFQTKTVYKEEERIVTENITNVTTGAVHTVNVTQLEIVDFSTVTIRGTNILGIVFFSILLGIIIGRMNDETGDLLYRLFDGLQLCIIKIIKIFIWYTPIGVMFLVAGKLVKMEDIEEEFKTLGWYIMTVLLGLFIHGFVVLPIIYALFTRKNPFLLIMHMGQALVTALGTASSSATMPLTLNCLEQNAKVDRRVTRFMIPVGATINMDGTALYEAVASIYLAQRLGHHLNAGQYVTVSLTATAAAIGAAGVPEAGLVTMLIVLTAIGLPATDETLGLILAVDWFLDRCRTMINVLGDSLGTGIVEKLSADQLAKMDQQHKPELTNSVGYSNQAYVGQEAELDKTRL